MPEITIKVRDKIAQATGTPTIVCGNADYTVVFDLDAEWTPYNLKTARFNYTRDGVRLHQDVAFTGSSCTAPVMNDVYAVEIGVYAGNIHTSTPARIPCERSATGDAAQHPDPMPDIYDQLLALLEHYGGAGIQSDVYAISTGGVLPAITAVAVAEEA